MLHSKIIRGAPVASHTPDPLQEARSLQAQIKGLMALLEFHRWQIETLNNRLYSADPGGAAARRLLALKQSER